MNKLNHVAIIMDGNGRWGLKKKGSSLYAPMQNKIIEVENNDRTIKPCSNCCPES